MLRGLIQTAHPLGEWKQRLLEDPGRLREAYLGTAQASVTSGPTAYSVKAPVAKTAAA